MRIETKMWIALGLLTIILLHSGLHLAGRAFAFAFGVWAALDMNEEIRELITKK